MTYHFDSNWPTCFSTKTKPCKHPSLHQPECMAINDRYNCDLLWSQQIKQRENINSASKSDSGDAFPPLLPPRGCDCRLFTQPDLPARVTRQSRWRMRGPSRINVGCRQLFASIAPTGWSDRHPVVCALYVIHSMGTAKQVISTYKEKKKTDWIQLDLCIAFLKAILWSIMVIWLNLRTFWVNSGKNMPCPIRDTWLRTLWCYVWRLWRWWVYISDTIPAQPIHQPQIRLLIL